MKIICVWFLWYGARQQIFSHFGPSFALLHPPCPNNPENQNFEKMKKKKKMPGDINILQKCTINDNHIIYGSWDMKCTRQIFFVILSHFLPFYPPDSLKNENLKKKKKKLPGRYHHFTQVYQKSWSYAILFLKYAMWQMNCHFSFWAIFLIFYPPPSPPPYLQQPQKQKVQQKWKKL